MKLTKTTLLDKDFVSGLGKVELDGKEQTVKLSVDRLEKLLKIAKLISIDDAVYITVETDKPIFIRTEKDSDMGLLLAPRVKDDDC